MADGGYPYSWKKPNGTWCTCLSSFVSPSKSWPDIEHSGRRKEGRLEFLGHIVDAQGVHVDPEKTRAVGHFPTPTTVTELQRFMGMVNQLGKCVPRLADINAPLR